MKSFLGELKRRSVVSSGTYNRKLEDIFAIQDEIASQVVEALKVTLLEEEEVRTLWA